MTVSRPLLVLSRWLPIAATLVLLIFTFKLYDFAYFSTDHFIILYWIQKTSGSEMVGHILNPRTNFLRPFGMGLSWMLWHCCELNPTPYHLAAFLIHILNVGLVYALLRRIVHSPSGAATGAALFAFQSLFSEIYLSFGTVFELLAAFLILLTIYIYLRLKGNVTAVLLSTVLFFFALKSKEMAITLPLILAALDWAIIRRPLRRMVPRLLPLALIAAWFLSMKSPEISSDTTNPYYMDFSLLTLGRGYGWYWNNLFKSQARWGAYAIASALLFTLFLMKRKRDATFFIAYVYISLLPVIFLINHRFEFYWYIPFFGISGLVAVGTRDIMAWLKSRLSLKLTALTGMVCFLIFCRQDYFLQKDRSAAYRSYFHGIAAEYNAFVEGLQHLPSPGPDETLFFKSMPRHFDQNMLLSATQVALKRTDIKVQLVDEFPPSARYRIRFAQNAVVMER